uniref:Uncharacterized protein n=1 Tax=Ditylenchus dipsaci TaxID=166011 RepID=A0A915D464_9BILA
MTSINWLWMKLEMSFFRAINMEHSPDEIFAKILSYKNVWTCPHLLINFSGLMQSTYDLRDLSPLHECQKLELCEFEEKLSVTDLTNYLHSFFEGGRIVLKLHLYENQWQHLNAFLDSIKETFLCSSKPQSFKVKVASWISMADHVNQETLSITNKLTNEQLNYDWSEEKTESELCCTIQRISL